MIFFDLIINTATSLFFVSRGFWSAILCISYQFPSFILFMFYHAHIIYTHSVTHSFIDSKVTMNKWPMLATVCSAFTLNTVQLIPISDLHRIAIHSDIKTSNMVKIFNKMNIQMRPWTMSKKSFFYCLLMTVPSLENLFVTNSEYKESFSNTDEVFILTAGWNLLDRNTCA